MSSHSRNQSPSPRLESFHSRSNLLGGSDGAAEERYDVDDVRRKRRSRWSSSNTWTDSSGGILSEVDDVEDRTEYLTEYNRLAEKHGVRLFVPDEYDSINTEIPTISSRSSGSWIKRNILRRKSAQTLSTEPAKHIKHKRSISDFSIRLKKRGALQDKSLQDLVRLCGVSLFYLPNDFAVGSLALPTCFRATAQYLVQHADSTKGIFRIPGSHSTINALYEHYASFDTETGTVVSGTVRCPSLPDHVPCDVYDVASAFKRFLSGLPGGILGSTQLLDAFLGIQAQFKTEPEWTRTKETKVRARLIALVVLSVRSHYRRELICAVFGLLSWIGRKAETAPRENSHGRPLPTTGFMGYEALGVVFGPLLIGDLLATYQMSHLTPDQILLPAERPTSRKERKKPKATDQPLSVDPLIRVKMVNSITAMLITHWRDVVRHLKHFGALKTIKPKEQRPEPDRGHHLHLHPSASTSFAVRKPQDWNDLNPRLSAERSVSPTPISRHSNNDIRSSIGDSSSSNEHLSVSKHRPRSRHMLSRKLSGARSMSILSPTREESAEEQLPSSSFELPPSLASSLKSRRSSLPPDENKMVRPQDPSGTNSSNQNMDSVHTINYTPSFEVDNDNTTGVSAPLDSVVVDVNMLSPQELTDRYKILPPPIKPSFMQRISPENKTQSSKGSPSHSDDSKIEGKNKTPKSSKANLGLIQRIKNSGPSIFTLGTTQNIDEDGVKKKSPPSALRVPSGIVANRLRDLTASDPGIQPKDRLQTPLLLRPDIIARRGLSSPIRNRNADSTTRSSGLTPKDPLEQASKEDDEASLAALASAMGSMDEDHKFSRTITSFPQQKQSTLSANQIPIPHSPNGKSDRDVGVNTPRKPVVVHTGRSEISKIGPTKETNNVDGAASGQSENSRRYSQRNASSTGTIVLGQQHGSQDETSPSYMRTTKSSIARRESVKDKIAKFNCADRESGIDSSPTKTPKTRAAMRRSDRTSRDSIVSVYTINPSPSPTRSIRSNRSDRSARSHISNIPISRRSEVQNQPSPRLNLTPAPLRISRFDPQTPRRDPTKVGDKGKVITVSLSNSLTPTSKKMSVSDLARTFDTGYDGNGSFAGQTPPRYGSPLRTGTVLPRPTPPPVAQHIRSIRPPALPMEPGVESEASTLPIIESVTSKGSNATLHDRIRNLQKQLQAKDEEMAQCKHQLELRELVPNGGAVELGTLGEQLREARREADMWKARAKNAERRLEVLANIGRGGLDGNGSESTDSEGWMAGTAGFFEGMEKNRNEEMSEIGDLSRAILNAIQGGRSESEESVTPKRGSRFNIDGKENTRRGTLTHTREGSEDYMGEEADLLLKSWDEKYMGPFELE